MSANKAFADGLRAAADWYEAHPEIPSPMYDGTFDLGNGMLDEKEEAATLIRALGSCKKEYSDDYFVVEKAMGAVRLRFIFHRAKVCVRKVVGVETVPAKFVEAHTIPASTKEIVEWECEPVLATAGSDAA